MRIDPRSLARGIRATIRRPILATLTLAAVATSALTPATTHAAETNLGSELLPGQVITFDTNQGQSLHSPNGLTELLLSSNDGALYMFRTENPNGSQDLWTNQWGAHWGADYYMMQGDGNFVGYQAADHRTVNPRVDTPVWSTGTQGPSNAYKLSLLDNGNLVIRPVVGDGPPIWTSKSAWYAPGLSRLEPGQKLTTGQELTSVYGRLRLETDGNLVLYRRRDPNPLNLPENVAWSSGTAGKPMTEVTMQTDGNFVGRGPDGKVYWRTVTYGHPGAIVVLQNDGNLQVSTPPGWGQRSDAPIPVTTYWQTNTQIVPCGCLPNLPLVMGV
jgi:hypothetical protein